MTEFELIERFFARAAGAKGAGTLVQRGIGDDCALIDGGDRWLAITTDLLVEHSHFLSDVDPAALGHKALAVNLSDLAAAGATPRCFQLAVALPRADAQWLDAFCGGLFALADQAGCALIGGDTTRAPRIGGGDRNAPGPLTICITAIGDLPKGAERGRDGARAGDDIWLSGTVGDARMALALRRGESEEVDAADAVFFHARMQRPTPRNALGVALRGVASAAVDVSDGLSGDLGHILKRSALAATLLWNAIPISDPLSRQPIAQQQACALYGGDDYELLFTAASAERDAVQRAAAAAATPVARIGRVESGSGLRIVDAAGVELGLRGQRSFDHFAE